MSTNWRRTVRVMMLAGVAGVAALSAGCASTAIAMKEGLGYAKREQLVDGVEQAREAQEEARDQFADALDEFRAVTGDTAKGGTLEAKYERFKKEFERSETKAKAVRSEIADVERVSKALFDEWEKELGQYSDPNLRSTSQQQLNATRAKADSLISTMNRAAAKMDPVLSAFRDQVLFLKHNLNAQAIAGLDATAARIEGDIAGLIAEMETSIAEAGAFIAEMKKEG